ncbi:MAG: serine hydrolase domain-containing protein [Alphaproteobacteria bacterium]
MRGLCEPRYAAVRDAFAANFRERGEVGASVCVIVDGRVVVDLVGGWADAARTIEWRPDTLVNLYSVGKAFVALLALRSVARGAIALDDPVASAWPEFAAGGKSAVSLRHALCHRAGVPAIRERLSDDDLLDWDRMTSALAATEPWWEPGTRHAYHTNTYGHLVGEVVRRTTGVRPGAALRELAASCDADLWCGLPDDQLGRCAEVLWEPPAGRGWIDPWPLEGDARMIALGYFNPPGYSSVGLVNEARWRRAQVPSTNAHGTAAGIARFYAALLEPGRLLPPDLLAEATRPQSDGFCPVLGEEVVFGLGFKPTTPRRPLGPNPRAFGHYGTGGSLGFADPDARVAFGYAMNHVIPRWQSTRNRALVEALYRC